MVDIKKLLKMSKQADYFDKKGMYKTADKIAKKIENDVLKMIKMKKSAQYTIDPMSRSYQYGDLPKGLTMDGSYTPYLRKGYYHPYYLSKNPFADTVYTEDSPTSAYQKMKRKTDDRIAKELAYREGWGWGSSFFPIGRAATESHSTYERRVAELQEHLRKAIESGNKMEEAAVKYELDRLLTMNPGFSPAAARLKSIASEISKIDYHIWKIRSQDPEGIDPESNFNIDRLQSIKHKLSLEGADIRSKAGMTQVYNY